MGGDLVSTWVAKPEGHAEDVATLVNNAAKHINANKANFDEVSFGAVAA